MATVVGYDETKFKRFTCYDCAAIVQYKPNEVHWNGQTDEGTQIWGLHCPGCGGWHRTNP